MKKFLILLGLLAGCSAGKMTPDQIEHALSKNRVRELGKVYTSPIDGNGVVCYVYNYHGVSCVKVK